jgi:hypothetical protein
MLFHYLYGKPVERIDATAQVESALTVSLADRTRAANERLLRLRRGDMLEVTPSTPDASDQTQAEA